VATRKVTGEEEAFSHTDLWDFQSNVDGSKAAVSALRPILADRDATLVNSLDTRFGQVQALLDQTRVGDGFKHYDELPQDVIKKLAAAVDALSEPLSKVRKQWRHNGYPARPWSRHSPSNPRRSTVVNAASSQLSRRRILGVSAAGAAALGVGAASTVALRPSQASQHPRPESSTVAFDGADQAGITTPTQQNLHFAALDVTTTKTSELRDVLVAWTVAARRMTAGHEVTPQGALGGPPQAPPDDTGEALDLPASNLTLTIGFGPSLFDKRFGLESRRPPQLVDIPAFARDKLDPARSNGDLCLQACADDPQVAVHAIRNLVRLGFGSVGVRWSQLGFGRSASTSREQRTPRNLFGFKDGTNNINSEDDVVLRDQVWAHASDGPGWMTGGTYLVARRIRMHVETWDRQSRDDQESIIGRAKGSGAALGQLSEFDGVDLTVRGAGGVPLVAHDAHIRLASPDSLNGVRLLRRGYNFVEGSDGLGHLDAGLFFLAFNRDTRHQHIPMQRALSSGDAMMEYVEHTGSAHFAVPPGPRVNSHWGAPLFE
jgi:deferrochelatase/peroxidase EfeB